jgi:hypothetical protein
MTEPQPIPISRGAIKIIISTSTTNLVAGQEFSIFVKIQNPFDIPISLVKVSTELPTELLDVDFLRREQKAIEIEKNMLEIEEFSEQMGLNFSFFNMKKQKKHDLFNELSKMFSEISFGPVGVKFRQDSLGPTVARDISRTTTEEISIGTPFFKYSIEKKIKGSSSDSEHDAEKKIIEEKLRTEYELYNKELLSTLSPNIESKILQPGNSTISVFTLKSKKNFWLNPSEYKLNINVEYDVNSIRNSDTIDFSITLKQSLSSILCGAFIGGIAGWFCREGAQFSFSSPKIVSLIITLIISTIAIVLFARKKDIQFIFAIEDFWGGLAIGFLVAYSGQQIVSGWFNPIPPI